MSSHPQTRYNAAMSEVVSNVIDVYPFRRAENGVEFLLLKRVASVRLGGTWQAVHGRIEAGETAWQAALRELKEETGLAPLGFWQIEFVNTFYLATEDRVLICPCFAAEIASDADVTLSHEHTDFRWEPTEQALRSFMWPGQRHAVREILEEIVTPGRAEPHLRFVPEGDAEK
jgi:8-oxo-dGTP pyrophosphatase MutT (NUDIX family)